MIHFYIVTVHFTPVGHFAPMVNFAPPPFPNIWLKEVKRDINKVGRMEVETIRDFVKWTLSVWSSTRFSPVKTFISAYRRAHTTFLEILVCATGREKSIARIFFQVHYITSSGRYTSHGEEEWPHASPPHIHTVAKINSLKEWLIEPIWDTFYYQSNNVRMIEVST